jgi:hypothetical protein
MATLRSEKRPIARFCGIGLAADRQRKDVLELVYGSSD